MAITPLWGNDASSPVSTTPGMVAAIHANVFALSFVQPITTWYGFTDNWTTSHGGGASSWSGSIGGFTTSGVTSNALETSMIDSATGGGTNHVRSGESWTFTWKTGCTIIGIIIFSDVSASVNFLGTDTSGLNFTGSNAPAETWTTS